MTSSTYRDSLTPEDRAIYDQMLAEKAANREANLATVQAAGVPRPAMRGIHRATSNNAYRIRTLEEHPREGRASRWSVVCEIAPASYTTYGWLVGPRGAARQIW